MCPLERICSLELEVFVLGAECREVLAFLRERHRPPRFIGKGGGFWLEIPVGGECPPVWMKVSGDGPVCTQDNVLEVALPETDPPSAAWMMAQGVIPWLGELEERLAAAGRPVKFLMGPGIHGRRLAFQVNVALEREPLLPDFYHALSPLLVTLGALLGPGGPTPRWGYVKSPRLCLHTREGFFFGGEGALPAGPIAYPRDQQHGSPHRAHVSLEHLRLPGSLHLCMGIVTLAMLACERNPGCFTLRFAHDPVRAGWQLARSLDDGVRVAMRDGLTTRAMTGLEIQEHVLERCVLPALEGAAALPAWAPQAIETWRATLRAMRAGELTLCSDFSVKRRCLEPLLAAAGLVLGSRECQSAYALCAGLLAAGHDPDLLLPGGRALPLSGTAWEAHQERVPPARLREAFELGLRAALHLELGWIRAGRGSLVEGILGDPLRGLPALSTPYLAPRARAREALLQRHRGDPRLRAGWTVVESSAGYHRLGDPMGRPGGGRGIAS